MVVSTHSIYSFPRVGIYRNFVSAIFKNADCVLGLSKQAANEIESLGVEKNRLRTSYWIDLNKFKKIIDAKNKLGWKEKFVVLFVGKIGR